MVDTNNKRIDTANPPEPGAVLVHVDAYERGGKPVSAYDYWRGANGENLGRVEYTEKSSNSTTLKLNKKTRLASSKNSPLSLTNTTTQEKRIRKNYEQKLKELGPLPSGRYDDNWLRARRNATIQYEQELASAGVSYPVPEATKIYGDIPHVPGTVVHFDDTHKEGIITVDESTLDGTMPHYDVIDKNGNRIEAFNYIDGAHYSIISSPNPEHVKDDIDLNNAWRNAYMLYNAIESNTDDIANGLHPKNAKSYVKTRIGDRAVIDRNGNQVIKTVFEVTGATADGKRGFSILFDDTGTISDKRWDEKAFQHGDNQRTPTRVEQEVRTNLENGAMNQIKTVIDNYKSYKHKQDHYHDLLNNYNGTWGE